jgi:hypothetical protein
MKWKAFAFHSKNNMKEIEQYNLTKDYKADDIVTTSNNVQTIIPKCLNTIEITMITGALTPKEGDQITVLPNVSKWYLKLLQWFNLYKPSPRTFLCQSLCASEDGKITTLKAIQYPIVKPKKWYNL